MEDPWTIVRRVAADGASGAAEIAARAAPALGALPQGEAFRAVRALLRAHPSMAPLWRLGTDVLDGPDPAQGAARFTGALERDGEAAGVLGPVLPPWLLTISYSSSVLAAVRKARVRLLTCMASEPGGEGHRMAEAGAPIRTRVIPDDEALRLVPAAAVVVGADAVTPHGVVNKVKTRALAEAARAKGIPCYAAAGETKFVDAELPIDGPFEPVPLDLFVAISTPIALLDPGEARAHAEAATIHPELAALLAEMSGRRATNG